MPYGSLFQGALEGAVAAFCVLLVASFATHTNIGSMSTNAYARMFFVAGAVLGAYLRVA